MKYILISLFCLSFAFSHAQTNDNPLNDIDQEDIQIGLDQMFNMLDSLPINLSEFGQLNQLFQQQFGDLSKDKDMMNDLMEQSLGMIQKMDMTQIQGLMDNFLKDFDGFNMEGFDFGELLDEDDIDNLNSPSEKSKKSFKKI